MMSSPDRMRAIVTGASSGIGRATALTFAKAGIDLALVSRSLDKLESVAAAAREVGVEAKAYRLDLAAVETVKTQIEAIATDFGPIDILVNNAGMGYTNLLRETSLEEWQEVLNINLTSVFQCVLGILPQMRERGRGTIINVASIAGKDPFPGWGAYSVSKAASIAFAKTLAAEERANGIRVTNICPGAVNTPIWDTDTVKVDLNREAMLAPETVARSILHVALLPAEAAIEEMTIVPSAGIL